MKHIWGKQKPENNMNKTNAKQLALQIIDLDLTAKQTLFVFCFDQQTGNDQEVVGHDSICYWLVV